MFIFVRYEIRKLYKIQMNIFNSPNVTQITSP